MAALPRRTDSGKISYRVRAFSRSETHFPPRSQNASFIPIQTAAKQLMACLASRRCISCLCNVCKTFLITDTKQRNTKAMKNTRAGPGHGGGTPPTRIRLCIRGKAGKNRSGRACSSLAVFPAFHCALGPSNRRVSNATAAYKSEVIANHVPQMRVQGTQYPGSGVRGPKRPPGSLAGGSRRREASRKAPGKTGRVKADAYAWPRRPERPWRY